MKGFNNRFVLMVLIRLASAGGMFLVTVYVSRSFSLEVVSEFYAFIAAYSVLTTIILFGADSGGASHKNEGLSYAFSLIVAILFCFVLSNTEYFMSALACLLSLPFVFYSFICRSNGRVLAFQVYRNVFFLFALIIPIFLLESDFYYLVVLLCLFVMSVFFMITSESVRLDFGFAFGFAEFFKNRIKFLAISTCGVLFFWMDVIIASTLGTTHDVAEVGVLGRISAIINVIYLLLLNYNFSKFGDIDAGTKKNVLFKFRITGVALISIFLFSTEYILGVFGSNYIHLTTECHLIVLAHASAFFYGPYKAIGYLNSKEKQIALVSSISVVIYGCLGSMLFVYFGLIGLISSFLLTYFIYNFLSYLSVRKMVVKEC